MAWNKKKRLAVSLGSITIAAVPTTVLALWWFKQDPPKPQDQDKIDVDFIEKAFNKEQNTFQKNHLPRWEMDQEATKEDLGITEPNNPAEVAISYKVLGIDQSEGEVEVEVTIQKGRINTKIEVTLAGFWNVEKFLKNFENLIQSQETRNPSQKPSDLAKKEYLNSQELGIEELSTSQKAGAEIKYSSKTFDDIDGKITIEVIVSFNFRIDDITDRKNVFTLMQQHKFEIIISGFSGT